MANETLGITAHDLEHAQEIIAGLYANGAAMAETIYGLRVQRETLAEAMIGLLGIMDTQGQGESEACHKAYAALRIAGRATTLFATGPAYEPGPAAQPPPEEK